MAYRPSFVTFLGVYQYYSEVFSWKRLYSSHYTFLLQQFTLDLDKCPVSSPDDSHPFDLTFRPYVWAHSTSELRQLIQSCNRVSVDSEASVGVYDAMDRKPGPHLLIEPTQPGRFYQDYGSLTTNLLDSRGFYADFKMATKVAEIDSESDIMCTRLQLSGSYKCVKCTKVSMFLLFSSL